MTWKILHIEFDEDARRLTRDGDSWSLEPRQAELLAFFCRNPDRVISRDEMVDAVWERAAVTDGAINRIVAKLRKALGDDARQSQFIVTMPRKGYRFIAPVKRVDQVPAEKSADEDHAIVAQTAPVRQRLTWLVIGLLLIGIAATWMSRWTNESEPAARFKSVTALTRGGELEFLPAVSPDHRYLIYSAQTDDRLDLFIKDLRTQRTRLISDQLGNAGRGDWSREGDRFLYLYTSGDACELRVLTFDPPNGMAIADKATVHQCDGAGIGSFAFGHDGRSIIYAQAPDPAGQYVIHVRDIKSGTIRTPVQPPAFLAANREFDLHPLDNRLIVASPDESQQLAFYIVDLDSNSMEYLYSMDGYICCPIWHQRGDRLLMTAPLPALSVVSMSLTDPQMETVYDSAHRIHRLKRIPRSPDLVYSGGLYDTDIVRIHRNDHSESFVVASAVADFLPVLSNDETRLAYVSERSGVDAIWLHDGAGQDRRLTESAAAQRYFDLKWSPNDLKLAALTINSIELVDVVTGGGLALDIPKQAIRGLSWFDDQTVAFSLLVEGRWQVHHYDLPSRMLARIDEDIAYRHYGDGHTLTLDSEGRPIDIVGDRMDLTWVDVYRRFHGELRGSGLYYLKRIDDRSVLRRRDLVTGVDDRVAELVGMPHFTVGADDIWSTREGDQSADIFRIEF